MTRVINKLLMIPPPRLPFKGLVISTQKKKTYGYKPPSNKKKRSKKYFNQHCFVVTVRNKRVGYSYTGLHVMFIS